MANHSRSKGAEAYAQRYKSNKTMEANRKRKLLKQLKLQPNNKQVEMALKDIRYRRKTPTKPTWSASLVRLAKIFKEFGGRFDMNFVHPDPKVSQAALGMQSPYAAHMQEHPAAYPAKTTDKAFFSLLARNNMRGTN